MQESFRGIGAAVVAITPAQAVAWFSDDTVEREEMRAALRRRARALLEESSRCRCVEIRERATVLETVSR